MSKNLSYFLYFHKKRLLSLNQFYPKDLQIIRTLNINYNYRLSTPDTFSNGILNTTSSFSRSIIATLFPSLLQERIYFPSLLKIICLGCCPPELKLFTYSNFPLAKTSNFATLSSPLLEAYKNLLSFEKRSVAPKVSP